MVRIYKAIDSEKASRTGYVASYVADINFRRSLDSCGVIHVEINGNGKSSPHSHEYLEEVFIVLSKMLIHINDTTHELDEGDVILVEPGEAHSFETLTNQSGRIIALKFPNLKDDKVVPGKRSES